MNLSAIETAKTNKLSAEPKQQAELRQAAKQFEAVLLMQLTSALSGANNDDDDKLFGNDGGSGLAQQMFSEQLATTIADAGGIGLADVIFNQLGGKTKQPAGLKQNMQTALAAVRDIKTNSTVQLTGEQIILGENSVAATTVKNNLSDKNASFAENDFAVVSASEMTDEAAASNAFLNLNAKRILNEAGVKIQSAPVENSLFRATRPRLVAEANNLNSETVSPKTAVQFQMPVAGRLSSDFGNRVHPVDHKVKFHKGIDIAAPRGTPINAAAEGKVIFAGWNKGYGNTVVIEHPDGKQTRYAHAEKLFVREGETVDAGQEIAAVGSTGKSTGPHLDFEILENNRQINPLEILAQDFPNISR